MLIDSHCHLDLIKKDIDLDQIINNAHNSSVNVLLTICTSRHNFNDIHQLTEKFENVFCSIGTHPHEVENEPFDLETLVNFSNQKKVIGIGECGLDYYYDNAPIDLQKECFMTHLKAAQITGLPLIIHSRNADHDMIDLLTEFNQKQKITGVIHCFTAGSDLAQKAIDLGFYISFSGIITFKNAQNLRDIAKTIPLDKILIETDSPYLAPVPKRGQINQPAYVKYVAEFMANLLMIPLNDFIKITHDNFLNLFNKAEII
ncbi:MAG: TatD family hydrolase [Alphaproteobacteria bacterium]|nr:TatD family hydrolase [Alphaproteobacteria bacterium]